jgi:plastocyanin
MRLVVLATALAVALVPAAEARRPAKICVQSAAHRPKLPKSCWKRSGGRPIVPGRASTPRGNPPTPPPTVARLGVTAREWSLVLSRPTLTAGPARVQLQNLGEDAHNLRIERTDGGGAALAVPLAESGERKEGAGTLSAGRYKVYCALPGHEAAGMRASLMVR